MFAKNLLQSAFSVTALVLGLLGTEAAFADTLGGFVPSSIQCTTKDSFRYGYAFGTYGKNADSIAVAIYSADNSQVQVMCDLLESAKRNGVMLDLTGDFDVRRVPDGTKLYFNMTGLTFNLKPLQ